MWSTVSSCVKVFSKPSEVDANTYDTSQCKTNAHVNIMWGRRRKRTIPKLCHEWKCSFVLPHESNGVEITMCLVSHLWVLCPDGAFLCLLWRHRETKWNVGIPFPQYTLPEFWVLQKAFLLGQDLSCRLKVLPINWEKMGRGYTFNLKKIILLAYWPKLQL